MRASLSFYGGEQDVETLCSNFGPDFALVVIGHVVRLINRWTVAVGPYNVSMNVSWAALVVSALIAIWGFMQIPQ